MDNTLSDTITIDLSDSVNHSTVDTINITGSGSGYTIGAVTVPVGGYTISGTASSYTTSSSYGNVYTTGYGYSGSNVNITSDGISMSNTSDIKIGDQSLKEFMTKMEQRLAILVPDPKKLEKFEALKKAYEHYKLMEKLCQEDEDNK